MALTDKQKKLIIIVTVILGCGIVITALLTNYWFLHALPRSPSLTPGPERTLDSIKLEIDNYKALSAVIKDNRGYLNDMLVTKFMKGLFDSLMVAIIAFVFGKPLIDAITARIKGK